MKKNLFYLFALICSMSLFTACSDDDKPGSGGEGGVTLEEVITNDIAGNYKGDLAVTVLGVPMEPVAQKVAVTKSGTEAVSLSINNFSFLGMSLGDIKLENCALAEENGAYTFTGTTSLNVTPVPGMNLTADVAAEGSFTTGNPTSITLNLDIKAELAGQQQDVTVVYTGTRLTGNESSEALITSFAIDSELVSEAPVIDNEAGTITFKVLDSAESLVFAPTIEVSAGATVSPASGEEQDFSSAVTYTVTAEDGTVKTYAVSVVEQNVLTYSFEEWQDTDGSNDTMLPTEIWSSSAAGAGLLGGVLLERETNEDGTYAAKMITFEYPGEANALLPKITSGSIFMGEFDFMPAFSGDRLSCTKFGVSAADLGLTKLPVRFKGMYKYTAGEKYLNATDPTNIIETEDVDQGSITAVLYQAQDEAGNEVTLTGHDVNTSEYIVAHAMILVENTESYQTFDIPFELRGDFEEGGNYKFAIVCSSSKDGDTFNGAGGSTLIVDEFQVICE